MSLLSRVKKKNWDHVNSGILVDKEGNMFELDILEWPHNKVYSLTTNKVSFLYIEIKKRILQFELKEQLVHNELN